MSNRSQIVWSDGLFLRPHHFQQQARYTDYVIRERHRQSSHGEFGFSRIELDLAMLKHGQISLTAATGVMPDGTLFNFPEDDLQPLPLGISANFVANEIIFLCLPLSNNGLPEVESSLKDDEARSELRDGKRFRAETMSVCDNSSNGADSVEIEVARVQPFLARERDDISGCSKLALLRVVECTTGGAVEIDKRFIPTIISSSASDVLNGFLHEFSFTLRERARALAERLGNPERSSIADLSDFMVLNAINRATPVLEHFAKAPSSPPEMIYLALSTLLGELSTYLDDKRLAPVLPEYDHAFPSNCWTTLFGSLRTLITVTLSASAQPIVLKRERHGYYYAPLFDKEQLTTNAFILAVKADVPFERIAREFPLQVKIGPIEQIRELVVRQLPGMAIRILPTAPRHLPFHAGYSYFLVEKLGETWDALHSSDGIALHVPDSFPGLALELWAVKENC